MKMVSYGHRQWGDRAQGAVGRTRVGPTGIDTSRAGRLSGYKAEGSVVEVGATSPGRYPPPMSLSTGGGDLSRATGRSWVRDHVDRGCSHRNSRAPPHR